MNIDKVARNIGYRNSAVDGFSTPEMLARKCISMVPLVRGDVVLDPCRGYGAFYNNYPDFVKRDWCEINEDKDFFNYDKKVDWIISNPPYSKIDKWLKKSFSVCKKGVGYLFGIYNITPRRIEMANTNGFGLTLLYLCKVRIWFGTSVFVIFEKGKENIISFDSKEYRGEGFRIDVIKKQKGQPKILEWFKVGEEVETE